MLQLYENQMAYMIYKGGATKTKKNNLHNTSVHYRKHVQVKGDKDRQREGWRREDRERRERMDQTSFK